MYNRYIPQPDGSYHRSIQPDRPWQNRSNRSPRQEQPKPEPCPIPEPEPRAPEHPIHREHHPPRHNQSVTEFLRQLLPRDFDTADLLIVLLLILMAGDNREEQNNALLTLALYLFM